MITLFNLFRTLCKDSKVSQRFIVNIFYSDHIAKLSKIEEELLRSKGESQSHRKRNLELCTEIEVIFF